MFWFPVRVGFGAFVAHAMLRAAFAQLKVDKGLTPVLAAHQRGSAS